MTSEVCNLHGDIYEEKQNNAIQSFKVVLLGNYGVGKSTFFLRFKENKFRENFDDRGLDSHSRTYVRHGETYKLQLWDTSGWERTMSFTENHYRYSHAVIIMYDVNERASITGIQRWKTNAELYCSNKTVYFIIGLKTDLMFHEDAALHKIRASYSSIHQDHFFQISTKEKERGGFEECLLKMIDILIKESKPSVPQPFPVPCPTKPKRKWVQCC